MSLFPTNTKLAAVLLSVLLGGCVSSVTGSTYTDGRFWYSNVKSASDIAGGPRQDSLIVVDQNGVIVEKSVTAGFGTLQTTVSGLSSAIVNASGNVAGDALIRPARNSTSATNNEMVSGTGGTGGTATGGTGGTANGGAGGAGGKGGTGVGGVGNGGQGGTGGTSGPVSNTISPITNTNTTGASTATTNPITNTNTTGASTATTGAVTNTNTTGASTSSTGNVNAVGGSATTTLGTGASCQGNCD